MLASNGALRVGIDGRKYPGAKALGPMGLFDRCAAQGYDGVFFRTVLDFVPDLDMGRLREIKARADELGLYVEMGLGKVNPLNTAEAPEFGTPSIRDIGDGDYVRGATRMIEAMTEIGCTAIWGDTANNQGIPHWGLFGIDRFRTDVSWTDQLDLTAKFLRKLAPVLRERGAVIAIETHEEITSVEILRLIEAVGDDVMGVTLDLANVVVRGEDPLAATRRLAPFVRKTHFRDIVLFSAPGGLERQVRACGDGCIDWVEICATLRAAGSTPNLTIENAGGPDGNLIPIFDRGWQAAQPDIEVGEVLTLVEHARRFEDDVRVGLRPGPDAYFTDYSVAEIERFIARSVATLRAAGAAPTA